MACAIAEGSTLGAGLLVRGGRVIDPVNNIDEVADISISDGKITSVGQAATRSAQTIDVTGKLVVPGLIDFHAHTFKHLSSYSLDPDRVGVSSGVTHINDMGTT